MKREISEKLDGLKKDELLVLARKFKLKGYTKLKKEELKELISQKVPEKKLQAHFFPVPRNKWKSRLNMIGIVASIVGAILALYAYFSPPGPTGDHFVYTFRIRTAGGGVPLKGEGQLLMLLESGTRDMELDKNDEAIFTGIPAKFKDQTVPVELKAKGWWFGDAERNKRVIHCRLTNNRQTLTIERDDSLSTLRFSVTDEKVRPVAGAVVFVEGRRVGQTDMHGKLTVTLEKELQKTEVSVSISKPGFKEWKSLAYPGTKTEIGVVLKRVEK